MQTVFISYVGEDAPFARYLVAALRAAGFEPWFDEERLVSGDVLEEKLNAAIAGSFCGIFLVAPRFHKSDHCMNELRIFAEDFPQLRRLPILRRPRKELKLPAYLGGRLKTQEWIEGETDQDEALYELFCAVKNVHPGPREHWAAEARKATATMPAEYVAPSVIHPRTTPQVASIDINSLTCDRGPEWNLFQEIYPQPRHHVVLIGGTPLDAHDYFVLRIENYLRVQPPFRRAQVDWRKRPKTKGEYFERIARALVSSGPVDVIAELKRWLASENLILVHPAITRDYEDPNLVAYYRSWLPELMEEVQPVKSLKCIQPVVWDSSGHVPAAIRKWFAGRPPQWLLGAAERHGRALIARMKSAGNAASTAAVSIELGPIGEKDIRDFCQAASVSETDCEVLLAELRDNDVDSPLGIIDAIDDFIERRRKSA